MIQIAPDEPKLTMTMRALLRKLADVRRPLTRTVGYGATGYVVRTGAYKGEGSCLFWASARTYAEALQRGFIDKDGWLTDTGRAALAEDKKR